MSVIRAKRSQQTSASLKKTYFLYVFDTFSQFFHLSMPKSEALPSFFAQWLCFKELWERFALVALYKRVTMSDSLRLLNAHDKRVTGAIHTFSQANQLFALSLTKKSDSLEKNYEHIPNPALRS